jgi:C4-dicarboxylate transporter, DctM subunit
MTPLELGIVLLGVLIVTLAFGMPVGVGMILIGGLGFVELATWDALFGFLKDSTYSRLSSYSLSVIPLFLLMGEFATHSGFSRALYRAANAWMGHWRGGLAIASIGGCAGFGAICGSSVATAATMARVALPEMRRYGYSGALATGSLAAGGTLGILIPPSIVLLIYAILVEQSIGALFLAAFVPGILATLLYMVTIAIVVRLDPEAGPAGEKADWQERIASLHGVWPVVVIFLVVILGIYFGWFTPTEGAAIGAFTTGVLAFITRGLDYKGFLDVLLSTAKTSAACYLILIGAEVYGAFLARSELPFRAAELVQSASLSPMAVVVAILVIYLILGCVMDALSMILLTIPVFFPVVVQLDIGMTPDQIAVWFGIIALMVVEVGLITPPMGLNVFVINSLAEDVPITQSFKGVIPFLMSDAVRIALVVMFPGLCLWLPGMW